ncbi:MAG: hypothetical protein EPN22_15045 [Nitrospirae bacterium]|nr:MAG: hypothetical protein EPN22_15045 [Nitrospirota bacterium]
MIIKKRKAIIRLLMLVILALFCVGCDRKGISAEFKVVDSGAWIGSSNFQQTWWLDNERVLFISNKALSPSAAPQMITIWNVKTGQIDFSHPSKAIICVQDGQVFFATKDEATGKRKHYRGTLENPQEYPMPGPNMRIDDRFDCDWVPKFSRAVPYKIKLKGDNYLEITEERLGAPVFSSGKTRYYERLDMTPIPLPVYTDLSLPYSIRFNQLRNAYLISPAGYIPGDNRHSMWWLSRDGQLTQVPFPKKIILPVQGGFTGGVRPLREGFLILYNGGGTMSMTNTGARGLYRIKRDDMEKVLLGEIHGLSISPDGCRAAFSHARNTKEDLSLTKPYRTVKTINFCEGGNKS